MSTLDKSFEKAMEATGAPMPEIKTIVLDNPELAGRWIYQLLKAKIHFHAEQEKGDELVIKIKIGYGPLSTISRKAGGYFRRGW